MIVERNLIKIKTYALGASIDDHVWRCNMTFELREITIRMMVKTVSLAPE
jgi:hypothetical protein